MSAQPAHRVPSFDLADRLRKSLRESGVSVGEMADYLGVHRNTVGAWINGRGEEPPKRGTLIAWSLRTGIPLQWIETGEDPDDGGGTPLAADGSNSKPAPRRRSGQRANSGCSSFHLAAVA